MDTPTQAVFSSRSSASPRQDIPNVTTDCGARGGQSGEDTSNGTLSLVSEASSTDGISDLASPASHREQSVRGKDKNGDKS
ncbi:hypothetical protein RRG08_034880 [Elysia crispata]|uniref:Uncharacterized protein n=1 Tax=Elysia crispata TaxID=231223 RepID=A0AAE0ZSX4_9GAST|nr:hypothetical protein RRG08_034880 [Elysia crispata]